MSVERQRDLVSSFDTRRRSALTTTTVKPLRMMVVTMTILDPKMILEGQVGPPMPTSLLEAFQPVLPSLLRETMRKGRPSKFEHL